jgi:hypothetical protein
MADEDAGIPFSTFAVSLATNAAVCFGDISEPGTSGPPKQNLEGARHMISILEMLERKTKGNLTPQERQLLEQILFELRMRFVQAQGSDKRIIEP